MRIISKFMYQDAELGYTIEDEGLTYGVIGKGLYDNDILEGLTKSGYKILNYHGDVLTPEGISIRDLVTEACTLTEDELQLTIDMAEYALEESEATKYFSRDIDVEEIKFKEPVVQIQTRDDLVNYLEKCKRMSAFSAASQDVRPLNSFVAREALFTIEEIASDPDVRGLFKVIEHRRKLQSYRGYMQLVQFLQGEGVLGETYNADDIKAAYLSWGIDGIKTPVVNSYVKVGVTSDILAQSSTSPKLVREVCLMDKKGVIFYSGGEIDLSDVDDFSQQPVAPMYEENYYDALRTTSKWDTECKPLNCLVRKYKTRSFYDLMDDNGVSYTCRVDDDRLVIFDLRGTIISSEFLFVKCLDGSQWVMSRVSDADKYRQWNTAVSKARELIKNRTVKCPVSSTYEMLLNEGVTPEVAVRYIARKIADDVNLNWYHQDGINYIGAHELYRKGPDKDLIHKYNPEGLEYDDIDTLIDIMCSTRDEMVERGEYLVAPKDDLGAAANRVREEIMFRPLENLEFVKLVKEGNITIDHMFAGRMEDGEVDVAEIASLMETACKYINKGNKLNNVEFEREITRIEESGIINFDEVIKERNAEYKGYLKDRAILNSKRAEQSTSLVYVTKVFREMSNAPIREQRHYMFECIDIPVEKNSYEEKALLSVSASIKESILRSTQLPVDVRKIIALESSAIAAKVLFRIATKQTVVSGINDNNKQIVTEKFDVDGNITLQLDIPVDPSLVAKLQSPYYLAGKYCVIYDWCEYEMSGNSAFNLYCLNANITPWEVKAKQGVKIPCYNFTLNYIKEVVVNGFSEASRQQIAEQAAKVGVIGDTYVDNSLLCGSLQTELITYTVETIDTVLSYNVEETIGNYYKRFVLHNKNAATRQEYLMNLMLKSDKVYSNYAASLNTPTYDENIYENLVNSKDASKFLSQFTPSVISANGNDATLLEDGNEIKKFDIKEESFGDVVRWNDLLNGSFKSRGICIYTAGNLLIVTDKSRATVNLKSMKKEQADMLVDKNIFYQLSASRYLIETPSCYLTMEVK